MIKDMGGFGIAAVLAVLMLGAAAGQTVRELAGHTEAVAAVAFSPDGKTLATGSFDKTVRLWDAHTFKELKVLEGHTDLVLALVFSRDSRRLVSGSQDRTVRVWNVGPPSAGRSLPAAPVPLRALAGTADGKLLLTAGEDGVIRLYQTADGKLVGELKGHSGPVYTASFSADGSRVFSAGADRTVRLWQTATGKLEAALETGSQPSVTVAMAPNGQALFTGDAAGQIKRFDLPVRPMRALTGHTAAVGKVTLSGDGKQIASVGADSVVRLHDLASGDATREIRLPATVRDIDVTGNLMACVDESRAIRLFDAATGNLAAVRDEVDGPPTAIALVPGGKTILVGGADGTVRAMQYPFEPAFSVRSVTVHDGPLSTVQQTSGGNVILTSSHDKTVRLWGADDKPIRAFALFAPVTHATITSSGQLVAAVGADQVLRVWAASGQEIHTQAGVLGPLAFSADGKWLAACAAENQVRLVPTTFHVGPATLTRHTAAVRALAFTPGSDRLLSAGDDKVVKVTQVATGKELKVLVGHEGPIRTVVVRADGNQIATGSDDKTVVVWDTGSGKAVAKLTGSTGPIVAVAASADFSSIAAASADNQLRIYRGGALRASLAVPSPTALAAAANDSTFVVASADRNLRFVSPVTVPALGKHSGKVQAIKVTGDGKRAVSAGEDKQAIVWDLVGKKQLRTLPHGGAVTAVAISTDGSRIVSGSTDKTCRVWNVADGKQLAQLAATDAVIDVAVSNDNKKIAFTSKDALARVATVAGEELQTFTITGPSGIAFTPDSRAVVIGSSDKLLRVGELQVAWRQQANGSVTACTIAPNGNRLVVASSENSVTVRDPANGQVVKQVSVPGPTALAISADSTRFAVGGADKALRLFDLNGGTAIHQYSPGTAPVTAVAFSPNGRLLVSTDRDGFTATWTTPMEKTAAGSFHRFAGPPPAVGCLVLPDNETVVSAGGDKTVRFHTPPPPPVVTLTGHQGQVYSVALSPDGKRAASGGADNRIILWDLATNKSASTLSGHKAQVYAVAFSPDGKLLASASGDRTVIVWELPGGKPLKTLTGPEDAIYQVAFTADGKQIIAGGGDKKLRLWDWSAGKLTQTLDSQNDEIYGLAFSADGKRFATSGYAGSLFIWDLASGKPVHQQKLHFGAFAVDFDPSGGRVAVANNDAKTYIVELPKSAPRR